MGRALAACGAPVVASFVLAGGVLTGKYATDPAAGRAAGTLDQPAVAKAAEAGRTLAALARRLGTTPAALAVAFTHAHPTVATVLFGATTPAQVEQNASALALAERLDERDWAELLQHRPTRRLSAVQAQAIAVLGEASGARRRRAGTPAIRLSTEAMAMPIAAPPTTSSGLCAPRYTRAMAFRSAST